ncbi:MAG: FG-GAP repeat protein [Chloroflexota bacterium]
MISPEASKTRRFTAPNAARSIMMLLPDRLRSAFAILLALLVLTTPIAVQATGGSHVSQNTFSERARITIHDGVAHDQAGTSVSISGNTAIIGASGENDHSGTAYIFVRHGLTWDQQASLTPTDAAAADYFGYAVAVSGDTALVGAYGKNNFTGAAYVFVRTGTVWSQQAKLTLNNGAAGDNFGGAVALSDDTVVIGAAYKEGGRGSAYVFVRSGSTWSLQQIMTANDGSALDYFGYSVAVEGDTAIVGAYNCANTDNAGAAYVFVRHGIAWDQQQILTSNDGAPGDYFGGSVALSGDTALVGAPYHLNDATGAAYVFVRSGAVWSQQTKLTATDGIPMDFFGYSVAMSGDTALIGTFGKNDQTGAAYVFGRTGTAWTQQQTLTASDASNNDQFGWSVAMDGGSSLAGAPMKNHIQGEAYVFANNSAGETIGVFRPAMTTFFLRSSNTTGVASVATPLGITTDLPMAGDWNGDGIDTIGVYRSDTGQFFLRDSNMASAPIVYSFSLGMTGDLPMAGDWNGDGKDSVGVFRPSNGLIYLKNELSTGFADFQMIMGVPGDLPLTGDWNGDGSDSPGIYRPATATFYLTNQVCNCSTFGEYAATMGVSGDLPFAGDWDGDGKTGIGVFRPTNGLIYLKDEPTSGFADLQIVFGIANDLPVAGHWSSLTMTNPAAATIAKPSVPIQTLAAPKLAPTFVP